MNKIILKTFELIDSFEESSLIKDLTLYKIKINKDKKLSELIQKGKDTKDKYELLEIRNKLYKNTLYKNYMEKYNELFYIVLKINNKYKKYTGSKNCNRE